MEVKMKLEDNNLNKIPMDRPHGTTTLTTARLTLRRHKPEDAKWLFEHFGDDDSMSRYSGWNPYKTPEMAQNTVQQFIVGSSDPRFYAWAIESEGTLVGTIGAYDYDGGSIEVGFSVVRDFRGHGYAAEALAAVLDYLTVNEGIPQVTAWCAAENDASRRTLEKAGMKYVATEKNGICVGDKKYDKMYYETKI